MERFKLLTVTKRNAQRLALAGSLVFSAAVMVVPPEAYSQTPSVPESRPLPSPPALIPKPEAKYQEPTDIREIIAIGAEGMGISVEQATSIVKCESGFKPDAVNPVTYARGLWQLMPNKLNQDLFEELGWNYWEHWSNGYRNTQAAIRLYGRQKLEAWRACL